MKFDSKQFKLDQKKLLTKIDGDLKKGLQEVTGRIMAHAVLLSPVGESKPGYTGGRLRKSWDIISIRKTRTGWQSGIINNVHYAPHVEFGHRTRGGKSYVDGQFFLRRAVEKALKEVKR